MSSIFRVGHTYCNGVDFIHTHGDVAEATAEYMELTAEAVYQALEPSPGQIEKHVRLIDLVALNENGELLQYISTGPFACEHRPAELPEEVKL